MEKVRQHQGKTVLVRVNALQTGLLGDDVAETVVPGLAGIVAPKVETGEALVEIDKLIGEAEAKAGIEKGSIPIITIIETALSVRNINEILSMKKDVPRLYTVAFGAADYTLDLGIEITPSGEELAYPRAAIAIACRAAGVAPPLDTPYMIDLKNLELLETDAMRAKRLGYQGKLCIHPNQIDPCNRIFSPSEKEIEFAEKVVKAFEEAEAGGNASIQVDGVFVDYPVVERAKRIVKTAEKLKND